LASSAAICSRDSLWLLTRRRRRPTQFEQALPLVGDALLDDSVLISAELRKFQRRGVQ
jgi:hypothetical protein